MANISTSPATANPSPLASEQADQQLVMFLEHDQLVADTSVPVPRARLSTRANAGLWALRVFVILVSIMVIYTFATQLK
jgi:hypothetical protein